MRVVVVEDQQELCNVLAKRISQLHDNYEIVGKAYNGLDGLKMIQATEPDAAFIDIRMPFMDGLQVMEQLNKDGNHRTKCIVLTAYSDFPYTQASIRSGAFDYLLKPVSTGMLEQVMDRVVRSLEPRKVNNAGSIDYALDQHVSKHLNDWVQDKKIKDELVLKVIHIIQAEYMHPITLNNLAERLHVNESHLCRVFSKKAEMNLIQFLNTFRIELAKILMCYPELRIGDIAKMTGFYNINYFGRLFKKHTGLSASEYKQHSMDTKERSG